MRGLMCACVLAGTMAGCALERAPITPEDGEGVEPPTEGAEGSERGADFEVIDDEIEGREQPTSKSSSPEADPDEVANLQDSGAAGAAAPEPEAEAGDEDEDAASDEEAEAEDGAEMDPPVSDVPPVVAEPPPRFSLSCESDVDCRTDETCMRGGGNGGISYCAQACSRNKDCEGAMDGTTAVCAITSLDGSGYCRLACDFLVNQECPGDMICRDVLAIFPAGTGTCGFPN